MTNEMMKALGAEASRQVSELFERNSHALTARFNDAVANCEAEQVSFAVRFNSKIHTDGLGVADVSTTLSAGKPLADTVEPVPVNPNQINLPFEEDAKEG